MLVRRPVARMAGAAVVGGALYNAGKNNANEATNEQNQNAQIDQLAAQNAAMQQQLAAQQAQAAQPVQPVQPAATPTVEEQLAKLNDTFQKGLITQEEYTAAKAKVLGI